MFSNSPFGADFFYINHCSQIIHVSTSCLANVTTLRIWIFCHRITFTMVFTNICFTVNPLSSITSFVVCSCNICSSMYSNSFQVTYLLPPLITVSYWAIVTHRRSMWILPWNSFLPGSTSECNWSGTNHRGNHYIRIIVVGVIRIITRGITTFLFITAVASTATTTPFEEHF